MLVETSWRDADSLQMQAVMDSMGEGLILIDEAGMIAKVNPYTLRSLGYKEDDLIGQWFSGVITAVDQHRQPIEHLQRPIVRALTTGVAVSEHTHYLRKDGTVIPVFLTVSPILVDGQPRGAVELFRDVTNERQLDIAKDEFVSLASHQLRTPASGVKAILSMVLAGDFGDLTEMQRTYLTKAAESNDRQLHVIEDLLNVARIDSGKMELDLDQVDLVPLVEAALSEHTSQLQMCQQTLLYHHPESLMAWVDVAKTRMAIDNLLSNASKYTTNGGNIKVDLIDHGDSIEVKIEDSGVGIDKADTDRLFTKFTRIENELSTSAGGTGLGLYLVGSIVALHGGNITVESELGRGSIFRINLPNRVG